MSGRRPPRPMTADTFWRVFGAVALMAAAGAVSYTVTVVVVSVVVVVSSVIAVANGPGPGSRWPFGRR